MKPHRGGRRGLRDWAALVPFCLIFVGSALWNIVDFEGGVRETERLGYPGFTVLPLTVAKLLGVAAVVSNRSRTLTDFAFAGFLYDVLLAILAHLWHRDAWVLVALLGLGSWVLAFLGDRTRSAAAR